MFPINSSYYQRVSHQEIKAKEKYDFHNKIFNKTELKVPPSFPYKQHSKEIDKYVEAVISGSWSGVKGVWNATVQSVLHPLDEVVYPVGKLAFYAMVLQQSKTNLGRSFWLGRYPHIHHDAAMYFQNAIDHLKAKGENFADANGFLKTEYASEALAMIFVPGALLKVLKAGGGAAAAKAATFTAKIKHNRQIRDGFHLPVIDGTITFDPKTLTHPFSQKLKQGRLEYSYYMGDKNSMLFYVMWLQNKFEFREGKLGSGALYESLEIFQKIGLEKGAERIFIQFEPMNKRLENIGHKKYTFKGNHPYHLPEYSDLLLLKHKRYPVFEMKLAAVPFVLGASASDASSIEEIKTIIAEAQDKTVEEKIDATGKIADITSKMANAKKLAEELTAEEIAFFDTLYENAKVNAVKKVTAVLGDFADDVNAIFNHQEFTRRVSQDIAMGTDTLSDKGIPLMHTLVNIFGFFDQKKALQIQNTIDVTTQIAKGAIGMIDVLSEKGIAAVMNDGLFSVASGNFLIGLSALFKLFADEPNPNEEIFKALQSLSEQMGRMHVDMLEGFRHISLGLEFISNQIAEAFAALMNMYAKNHQEVRAMLTKIEKAVYINTAYLEMMLDFMQTQKKNDYINTINNDDWSEVIADVENDCYVYEKSMTLDLLRKNLRRLVDTLKNVQKNSILRSRVKMNDLRKVHDTLGTASPYVGGKDPADSPDDQLIFGEQNIHLVRAYLKERFKGNPMLKELPEEKALHNPAALLELSDAAKKLFHTYRKRKEYLGVPDDIHKQMETFHAGIMAIKNFTGIIASSGVLTAIMDDYKGTLSEFNQQADNYLSHAMYTFFKEEGLKKNGLQIDHYKTKLSDAHKVKEHLKLDGTDWFKTETLCLQRYKLIGKYIPGSRGMNFDVVAIPARWSGINTPDSCPGFLHFKLPDDSTFKPVNNALIENAKLRYRKIFDDHVSAQMGLLTKQLNAYQPVSYEKIDDFQKSPNHLFNLIHLDPNFGLDKKHYFIKDTLLLPVTREHLELIPIKIRFAHEMGLLEMKFECQVSEDKKELLCQGFCLYEKQRKMYKATLFEQTIPLLPAANPLEAAYYAWFGGTAPKDGSCSYYDQNLGRHSTVDDAKAINEYEKRPEMFTHRQVRGLGGADDYRVLYCQPHTQNVEGMMKNDESGPTTNREIFNSWPVKVANQEELHDVIHTMEQRIRGKLMRELGTILRAKSTKTADEELELVEGEQQSIHDVGLRLNIKADVLRIALRYSLADFNGPVIPDTELFLNEIDQYKGGRIHPLHLLKRIEQQQDVQKAKILAKLGDHGGPYQEKVQEVEELLHEIAGETVDGSISEIECKGAIECEKLKESKTFLNLFQTLPQSIQESWNTHHPYMRLLPAAESYSGSCSFPSDPGNIPLLQLAIGYVKKWLPWNRPKEITESRRAELQTHLATLKNYRHQIAGLKGGVVGQSTLFDDILAAIGNYARHSSEEIKQALNEGKISEGQLSEIEEKMAKIEARIDSLTMKEATLNAWKAERLPQDKQMVVGYNCFDDVLTRTIESYVEYEFAKPSNTTFMLPSPGVVFYNPSRGVISTEKNNLLT